VEVCVGAFCPSSVMAAQAGRQDGRLIGDMRTLVVFKAPAKSQNQVSGQGGSSRSRCQFMLSLMAHPTQGGSLSLQPLHQCRHPSSFSLARRSESYFSSVWHLGILDLNQASKS
jgi:hypothetical protein